MEATAHLIQLLCIAIIGFAGKGDMFPSQFVPGAFVARREPLRYLLCGSAQKQAIHLIKGAVQFAVFNEQEVTLVQLCPILCLFDCRVDPVFWK